MAGVSIMIAVLLLSTVQSALGTPVEGASCKFPSFLLDVPRWETEIKDERQATGKLVKFSIDSISVTDLIGTSPNEISYDVTYCESPSKFLLKQKDKDHYFCADIIKRSKNVFQWKKSRPSKTFEKKLCNDDNLILDKWPFISPFPDQSEYESPPFNGGYKMQIYDNGENEYLCEDYWIAPKIESECIRGEGMMLNFRHFDCLGSLGMDMTQNLFSLGTWVEGNFEYSVLINDDDLWPKVWMARTSKGVNTGKKFDVDIFREIVCEIGSETDISNKYMTWSLSRIDSDCEDEAKEQFCAVEGAVHNTCDEIKQQYCRKSCGFCPIEQVYQDNSCEFIEDIKGTWQVYANKEDIQKVTFEKSAIKLPGNIPSFNCFNTTEKMWLKGTKRKPLVATLTNGCEARYVCLEAEKKTNDVLSYRLSEITTYDQSINISNKADYICSDEKFENERQLISNKNTQILVKELSGLTTRSSTDCGIRKKMTLDPIDDTFGWGILNIGDLGTSGPQVVNKSCVSQSDPTFSNISFHSNDWQCLSHFEQNLDEFLIVETDSPDVNLKVQCWITHKTEWSPDVHLYAVSPSACNSDIPIRVQIGSYKDYVAAYKILNSDSNEKVPCEFIKELKSKIDKPDLSLTTLRPLVTQNIPPSDNNSDVYNLNSPLVTGNGDKIRVNGCLAILIVIMVFIKI